MFAQIDKIITCNRRMLVLGASVDHASSWSTGIFANQLRLRSCTESGILAKLSNSCLKMKKTVDGEVTSFGALCTALSATIGTGNITGVATAIALGGPGALFWMVIAAFFGMASKYAEGLLAIKYRTIDEDGHVLGGPFYYIENGMGKTVDMACEDFCILRSRSWTLRNRYIYTGKQYCISG